MDSADFITLLLMDKGYYDYDYKEPPKPKEPLKKKTDKEVGKMLKRFGFATKLNNHKKKESTPVPTDDEIRNAGLEFIRNKTNKQN